SVSIDSATGGDCDNLAPSASAAETVVTDTPDNVTLSLSATAAVAEGGNITYTATLSHAAQGAVTVTLSNGETITIADGATSGSVSVAAQGDDVYQDGETVSVSIDSATGGNFENLVPSTTAAETVVTDTTDNVTLSLSATPTVAEGGNITYPPTLSHAAQGAVTVTLSNGETITIADGATSGSVSVAAQGDDVYQDGETVSVSIDSATGGNFEILVPSTTAAETVVTDTTDNVTLSLSATPTVAEGGNITYTATLSHAAQGAVTVTLSNGQTITIADGATSGSVSVAAQGDDVYQDGETVSVSTDSATGGTLDSLVPSTTAAETVVTDTTD